MNDYDMQEQSRRNDNGEDYDRRTRRIGFEY
jgi:hypothetical protein